MKKLLTIACIAMCALMLFACADKKQEVAEPENTQNSGEMKVAPLTADVYVTVSFKGELVVTQSKITTTDLNDDNKINIDEVLVATHKLKYEGEDGYASSVGQYGLSIDKLWGDTSYAFGYYLNNQMVMTDLNEEVKNGDYITAFVYKNADWSDTYTYFDVCEATAVKGGEFELTLKYVSFNPSFSIAGSKIISNGVATDFVTDAEGRVKLSFENAGTYVLSATSETATLVPAVCVVTVK